MSRIGKKIIIVPEGVNVDVAADNTVTVTGPKGTLTRKFSDLITIEVNGNEIECKRHSEEKTNKQLHGTTRALIANMIEGVKMVSVRNLKSLVSVIELRCRVIN